VGVIVFSAAMFASVSMLESSTGGSACGILMIAPSKSGILFPLEGKPGNYRQRTGVSRASNRQCVFRSRIHQFTIALKSYKSYPWRKRRHNMFRKLMLLLTIPALMAGAACAPVNKAEKQSEQVCKYLVLFEESMDDLQTAEKFADKNAIEAHFEVVRMNFNDLVQSASALEMTEQEDFEAAVNDLMAATDQLPEGATAEEALQQLQEPIQEVVQAAENLKAGLNCVDIAGES
jgi:hypothetical protein